jgi:hypothetical protein
MTVSRVYTAAGTKFAISLDLPATHTIAGFAALTYTDIGEIVDGGSAGKTYNKTDHSPLGEREVLSLKASFTQGTRTLGLGRDLLDAGQALLVQALDIDTPVSFRITYQNGDVSYITATVDSYTDDIGTIDSIVGTTVSIAHRNATIRLFVTGVLTASINTAGTGYASDGTFTATQASTSGSGTGAKFTVVIASGAVTTVSVLATGSGYEAADTVTIAIDGNAPTTPAIIDVDSVVTEAA